jgi:catechol 2,3-dioxygenase-like lactoylglutathione lyase family enzyme
MIGGGYALRLDRIGLNVWDLGAMVAFYTGALGFEARSQNEDAALSYLLGTRRVRKAVLARGKQTLELTQCDPPGRPYPEMSRSNDLWFQHCALATQDIRAASERLGKFSHTVISRAGPQALGSGIVAFKFRDPDGHPLELIQFAKPDAGADDGIDHSAISVADAQRSIAFYSATLGLSVTARQVNRGAAQDRLDDLDGVELDVVSLAPRRLAPHVELLGYREPRGRSGSSRHPTDIAASRLVFVMAVSEDGAQVSEPAGGTWAELLNDPDGHILMLEYRQ